MTVNFIQKKLLPCCRANNFLFSNQVLNDIYLLGVRCFCGRVTQPTPHAPYAGTSGVSNATSCITVGYTDL
jgi:hypothetical protein